MRYMFQRIKCLFGYHKPYKYTTLFYNKKEYYLCRCCHKRLGEAKR